MSNIKEIKVLTDYEHVLSVPSMYIGSIEDTDEYVIIIKNEKIFYEKKLISLGFYKLFNEILDNAFDEAKRINRDIKIYVYINSKENKVTIYDSGDGFYKGSEINKKSGLTNIETALTYLRAGSNFNKNESNLSIIGAHGIGASIVNMLSSFFEIETINENDYYYQKWENFKTIERIIRKKNKDEKTGTKISFIPRKDIFKEKKWDFEYLKSLLIIKKYIFENDKEIKNIEFKFFWDDNEINLNENFLPENIFEFNSKIGKIIIWPKNENNIINLGFINSSLCDGNHISILKEELNKLFEYNNADNFYNFILILYLPSKIVNFGDQSKTKFVIKKSLMYNLINKNFKKFFYLFPKSEIFKEIKNLINEYNKENEIKKLNKVLKNNKKRIISDKYFPPSKRNENLFIVEGESALGSILQKRNSLTDGVFCLKGKIKNVQSISDLLSSNELIELMNILNLSPYNSKNCSYEKIIIATDWDPDGIGHIASLLINLFFKWFKDIIIDEKLYILALPLLSIKEENSIKYFYSLQEFEEYSKNNKYLNLRYLKGLGSFNINDWEYIMKNKLLIKIKEDINSEKYLNIIFGNNSEKRKKWLSN